MYKSVKDNDVSRRSFLGAVAVAGIGVAALAIGGVAEGSVLDESIKLGVVGAPTYMGMTVMTAAEWSRAIYPTVHLSHHTCLIAQSKAQNSKVQEFAKFELDETSAVDQIERDSGNPVPPKSPKAIHILALLNSKTGNDFDVAFMKAQRDAHSFLRDLTANFLMTPSSGEPAEMAGRHLALLSLQFFKEHLQLSTDILAELGAS